MCYFLCYFLKTPEFGRSPEIWELATALGQGGPRPLRSHDERGQVHLEGHAGDRVDRVAHQHQGLHDLRAGEEDREGRG